MDAIIIKVAGIGLKVTHLGKTLADMQPTLRKLVIVSCGAIRLVALVQSVLPPRMTCMDRTYAAKAASTRHSP